MMFIEKEAVEKQLESVMLSTFTKIVCGKLLPI